MNAPTSIPVWFVLAIVANVVVLLLLGWAFWSLRKKGSERLIFEGILLAVVFVGGFLLSVGLIISLVYSWTTLFTHYDLGEIFGDGIRIQKFIRSEDAVVFTNGEKKLVGVLPKVVIALVFLVLTPLFFWPMCEFARRFTPRVWAELEKHASDKTTTSAQHHKQQSDELA